MKLTHFEKLRYGMFPVSHRSSVVEYLVLVVLYTAQVHRTINLKRNIITSYRYYDTH